MPANAEEVASTSGESAVGSASTVPKRITNAQTVCNEKNEKGKLCNGHLKQLKTAGEPAEVHLRGDDVLFKCHLCGTLYMGPPLGHVRDPDKQSRFVEAELSALLQAAGGTLPVIKKNEKGVYVLVEAGATEGHAAAPKPVTKVADSSAQTDLHRLPAQGQAATDIASAAPLSKPAATASPVAGVETPAGLAPDVVSQSTAATPTTARVESAQPDRTLMKRSTYAGVEDTGPVSGETREQKIERLTKVVAGAKQRSEGGGS
jgi:hypothetical protein